MEEGEKGSEGTPWLHSLPLSLLQVLRGARLSIRLWTSTLKTTIPFRYPTLASGVGVVCASESCRLCVTSSKWPLGLHYFICEMG